MSLESDLTSSLQGNATLVAVVSTRTEYGALRQSQTLPAVTWHVMTRTFEHPISRSVAGIHTYLHFDCWATTPAGAEAVAVALKTALLAFTTSTHCLSFTGEYEVPEPDDVPVFHRVVQAAILT